jgi:cytochrome c oxidase cbb3-type subunit III
VIRTMNTGLSAMKTLLYRAVSVACCSMVISCARHEAAQPASTSSGPPAIRYEAHIAAGGRQPNSTVPANPVRGDATATKNGALLFTAMNCDGCHGGDASGWVGPNLADGRWRYGGADEEIFSSIYFGRPKGMPAFGGVLGASAIWNIVAYLKSLPVPPDVPTESWE